MKSLQQAARAALDRDFDGKPSPNAAPIERMTVSVDGASGHELVSLRMNDGSLAWSCTCGLPRCEHAQAALGALAEARQRSSVPPPPPRSSEPPAPPRRTQSSDRHEIALPHERHQPPAAEARDGIDRAALAESLDDVLISIARAGVGAGRSASVGDALARLRRASPQPPLALERWLGRLEQALASGDVDEMALLLAGASALVDALRVPEPRPAEQHARVQAWLGNGNAHDGPRLTDRTFLEIAREQLAGAARGSIERRYMIDLESGHIYREERVPGGEPTSLGPCPRLLSVSLATLEPGPPPARIHVLQYTATPTIDDAVWRRLVVYAEHDFEELRERYLAELAPYPGIAEPFALVAPAGQGTRGQNALLDAAGHALALAGPDGGSALRALDADRGELLWLCGRLCSERGELALRLAGAATLRAGRVYYVQL